MDREAWQAIVHEVTESDTTKQLSLSYSYSNQNTGTGERIAQRNRIKNPEIDPHIYSQLIFHLTKERQYNGKKKNFSKNCAETTGHPHAKTKMAQRLHTPHKNCLKMDHRPNIKLLLFSCPVISDSLQPHESQPPGLPVYHQLPESTQTHVL